MPRTVQTHIMLTEEERTALVAAAAEAGEAVSVYVRRAIREQMFQQEVRRVQRLMVRDEVPTGDDGK